jgi:SagB-type dehydrogenase family enzyme
MNAPTPVQPWRAFQLAFHQAATANGALVPLFLLLAGGAVSDGGGCGAAVPGQLGHEVRLPEPRSAGPVSVEEAIGSRRSVRDFRSDSLELSVVSQLLWAVQGMTDDAGLRAVPSAGATYPLEVYVVAGAVRGFPAGVYRYRPHRHSLRLVQAGDQRRATARAALNQTWMADAPVTIVVAAVFARTTRRYGERGRRYVHMEVGHAAQNVYLQAEAMGLGTTVVGAFVDREVSRVLGLEAEEQPLALLPVGFPR